MEIPSFGVTLDWVKLTWKLADTYSCTEITPGSERQPELEFLPGSPQMTCATTWELGGREMPDKELDSVSSISQAVWLFFFPLPYT